MAQAIERGSLHATTLALLRACPIPPHELYQQAGVSFYWLKQFRDGAIVDPSVNRVQKLYEFLIGKKLEV